MLVVSSLNFMLQMDPYQISPKPWICAISITKAGLVGHISHSGIPATHLLLILMEDSITTMELQFMKQFTMQLEHMPQQLQVKLSSPISTQHLAIILYNTHCAQNVDKLKLIIILNTTTPMDLRLKYLEMLNIHLKKEKQLFPLIQTPKAMK